MGSGIKILKLSEAPQSRLSRNNNDQSERQTRFLPPDCPAVQLQLTSYSQTQHDTLMAALINSGSQIDLGLYEQLLQGSYTARAEFYMI